MFKPSLFIEIDKLINEAFFSFDKPADKSFNEYTVGFEFEILINYSALVKKDIERSRRSFEDDYESSVSIIRRAAKRFLGTSLHHEIGITSLEGWWEKSSNKFFNTVEDLFNIFDEVFDDIGIVPKIARVYVDEQKILNFKDNNIYVRKQDIEYIDKIRSGEYVYEIDENSRLGLLYKKRDIIGEDSPFAYVLFKDDMVFIIRKGDTTPFEEYIKDYYEPSSEIEKTIFYFCSKFTLIELNKTHINYLKYINEEAHKDYLAYKDKILDDVYTNWFYENAIDYIENTIIDYVNYVKNTIGKVFEKYNTEYIVGSDSSLSGTGVEVRTTSAAPKYPIALKILREVFQIIKEDDVYSTDSSCGLHFGLGTFTEEDIRQIDWLKYSVFLGDDKFLNMFGRENNKYTVSILREIEKSLEHIGQDPNANEQEKARKIINDFIRIYNNEVISFGGYGRDSYKYRSTNFSKLKSNYIEIRIPGGENYENRYSQVVALINRTISAIQVAKDPEAYKKEYYKKLYKIMYKSLEPFLKKDFLSIKNPSDILSYYFESQNVTDKLLLTIIKKLLLYYKNNKEEALNFILDEMYSITIPDYQIPKMIKLFVEYVYIMKIDIAEYFDRYEFERFIRLLNRHTGVGAIPAKIADRIKNYEKYFDIIYLNFAEFVEDSIWSPIRNLVYGNDAMMKALLYYFVLYLLYSAKKNNGEEIRQILKQNMTTTKINNIDVDADWLDYWFFESREKYIEFLKKYLVNENLVKEFVKYANPN